MSDIKSLSFFNQSRRIKSFKKYRSDLLCAFQTKYRVSWRKNKEHPSNFDRERGHGKLYEKMDAKQLHFERERERERMSKHANFAYNFIQISCGKQPMMSVFCYRDKKKSKFNSKVTAITKIEEFQRIFHLDNIREKFRRLLHFSESSHCQLFVAIHDKRYVLRNFPRY